MEKSSKFWKLFFGSGSVTAVNALRAFAVNKLLAVFLPPAAFACVGQFMNWMSIGQATSSLAMQNGWVSLTAQNKDNLKQLHGVWRGGFRITTFATIATCIIAVIFCFAAPLEKMLPGVHPRLAQAAILFALPGILATNIVTIASSVMNGLGSVRRWALIQTVSSLLQIVWVAFFLYTGRLSVLSIIATQTIVAGFFVTCAQVNQKEGRRVLWIIDVASIVLSLYIIAVKAIPSLYWNGVTRFISSYSQEAAKDLAAQGYGIPIGDSITFADYVIVGTVEEVVPKLIKYYKQNSK